MNGFSGHTPEFLERNRKKLALIDAQPKGIRELVHDFNWTLVDQFLRIGVTNPKHIRHLITAARDGANFAGNGLSAFFCKDCPHRKGPNPASSPNSAGISDSKVGSEPPSPNGSALRSGGSGG